MDCKWRYQPALLFSTAYLIQNLLLFHAVGVSYRKQTKEGVRDAMFLCLFSLNFCILWINYSLHGLQNGLHLLSSICGSGRS
jgi:hypothetical protein